MVALIITEPQHNKKSMLTARGAKILLPKLRLDRINEILAAIAFTRNLEFDTDAGFDHRAGHFRPPGMAEGVVKLPVLQALIDFFI